MPKSVRHNRLEQKYCNQNVCGRNQDVPETCPNLAVTTTSLAAVKQDLAERGPNLIEPGLANRAQVWLGQSAQVVRGETDSTILFCSDRRLDFMALDARPLCTPRRVIQRAETSTRGAPTLTPSRPRGRRGRAHIAGEVAPLWHCTGGANRSREPTRPTQRDTQTYIPTVGPRSLDPQSRALAGHSRSGASPATFPFHRGLTAGSIEAPGRPRHHVRSRGRVPWKLDSQHPVA